MAAVSRRADPQKSLESFSLFLAITASRLQALFHVLNYLDGIPRTPFGRTLAPGDSIQILLKHLGSDRAPNNRPFNLGGPRLGLGHGRHRHASQ